MCYLQEVHKIKAMWETVVVKVLLFLKYQWTVTKFANFGLIRSVADHFQYNFILGLLVSVTDGAWHAL